MWLKMGLVCLQNNRVLMVGTFCSLEKNKGSLKIEWKNLTVLPY